MKQLNFWTKDEQSMIDKIGSQVKLTKTVAIPPMQAIRASGVVKLPCLSKRVNVTVEGNVSLSQRGAELIHSFLQIKPGSY